MSVATWFAVSPRKYPGQNPPVEGAGWRQWQCKVPADSSTADLAGLAASVRLLTACGERNLAANVRRFGA